MYMEAKPLLEELTDEGEWVGDKGNFSLYTEVCITVITQYGFIVSHIF